MHKAVTGAFIGAVVGGGVAAYQAQSGDTPSEDQTPAIAKGAAEGALAGGAVGFFVQWRINRRRRKAGDAGVRGLSKRARKRADRLRERVLDVAEDVLPHVEELADKASTSLFDLAEAARPHVQSLAGVAREKAFDLAELAIDAARPHAETAAEVARQRADQAAGAARHGAEVIIERTREAA
jgi:hypothetical protein